MLHPDENVTMDDSVAPETEEFFDDEEFPEVDEEGLEQDELEALTRERDEIKDQLLRTVAEMQNVRRRAQLDKEQAVRFATEDLVLGLLPVLDNFGRTLASLEQGADVDSVIEGVKMVERQLMMALENANMKRISSVGAPFDPEIHEAIGFVETSEMEEGTVAEELEIGFTLNGKVIRPAKVRIAKAGS